MSTKGPKPKAPKAPKASKAAKTLTKAQMVADLADRAGLTKAQVQDVFAALADVVAAELKAGRPATIGVYFLTPESIADAGERGQKYAAECARIEAERRAA